MPIPHPLKVLALSGSLRTDSSNSRLLRAVAALAPPGMTFSQLDRELLDIPAFSTDLDPEGAVPPPGVARLRNALRDADAVVMCCPEYAAGVPGAFKNALDWLVSSGELLQKRTALLMASPSGAPHAHAALVSTLRFIGVELVFNRSVKLTGHPMDAAGRLTDPDLTAAVEQLLAALQGHPPRAALTATDLLVRQARVEDAPVLAAAERAIAATPGQLASRPHELEDAKFAAKVNQLMHADNGRYLVAEHAGSIVGHAMLDPMPLESTRHVVHLTLAVHPGAQGRGVGNALLGALIQWARDAPPVRKIELRVRSGNAAAMALYRKLGFEEEGRMRKRIEVGPGQYVDDVSMALWVKD